MLVYFTGGRGEGGVMIVSTLQLSQWK